MIDPRALEQAREIIALVEWQMSNFRHAEGETSKQCEQRRLIEAIATALEPVELMRSALKPFAECAEQIDSRESDEEWAKFRLIVRNFRDAARALDDDGAVGNQDKARAVEKITSLVLQTADQYSEVIDGEHRYADDGSASLTLTLAEWRELAGALRGYSRTSRRSVEEAGEALLDRIKELDFSDPATLEREWHGFVTPAINHLESALQGTQMGRSALGIPIGLKDMHGTPVHIGDTLRFDEKEWGGPCTFIIELNRGEIEMCGSPSDISSWCEVIKPWHEL